MNIKIIIISEILFSAGCYLIFIRNNQRRRIKGSVRLGTRNLSQILWERINSIKGKEVIANSEISNFRIKKGQYEKEVFNSCITLKNLAIVQKEVPMSQDFILEQLMENAVALKPVYAEVLLEYRSRGSQHVTDVFVKYVPSKSGKNFAAILSKLEKINPAELLDQITAFEEVISQERKTRAMKKAERNSIIITMFATATIFALLLNFAVVVVFMDTISMLGQVF
ncbi:MAG: hypothetical protein PHH48_03500 [Eubacteriales bacterium]|nr:hypothetical protein [Eubacteriales bacterium]